jgi:hypothetical protein
MLVRKGNSLSIFLMPPRGTAEDDEHEKDWMIWGRPSLAFAAAAGVLADLLAKNFGSLGVFLAFDLQIKLG